MAGKFLLRGKDDTENPIAPRLYWLGVTEGRLESYLAGVQTVFKVILAEGARSYNDTGCNRIVRVMYAGFDLPEFDSGGIANWVFHSGVIPRHPVYLTGTFNETTNRFNRTAHGYAEGEIIAFHNQGGDMPAELSPHLQYKTLNKTNDDFQIATLAAPTVPIDFTDAGTGTLRVYAADGIGLFDTEQGRSVFFPESNVCNAGLTYLEVRLPTELSNGEDEPTKLKVIIDGKLVYDYQLDGKAELEAIGSPISAKNPALVAMDVALNDAGYLPARFNGQSILDWRDRCAELIDWEGGNENPAHPLEFDVLTNAVYDAEEGNLLSTGSNGGGFTELLETPNASAEGVYNANGEVYIIFNSGQTHAAQISGAIITATGLLYYTNGTQVTQIGSVFESDRIKIAYEEGIFAVYKNSVPVPITGITIPPAPASFYIYFGIQLSGGSINDIRVTPSGTDSTVRQVERFNGGIVISQKTPVPEIWESEIHLSAGHSWQDVDGEITVLTVPDRTPVVATLRYDPENPETSNIKKVIVHSRNGKGIPNHWRFSFRDSDHPLFKKKYHSVDRPARRGTDGFLDSGMIPYGVMTESQVQRLSESRVRLAVDLDQRFTVHAFLDNFHIAKGDFINLVDPTAGLTEGAPALCMVLDDKLVHGSGGSVEEKHFILQRITTDFYSDTDHGAISADSPPNLDPHFVPPPPLVSLTLNERLRRIGGATIPVMEGNAAFAPHSGQRGRVWLKELIGVAYSVTPDQANNEFVADTTAAQTFLESLDGESVSVVAVSGIANLPAELDFETEYTLNLKGNGNFELLDDLAAVVEFTDNGTGTIRIYAFDDWGLTSIIIQPNADLEAVFSYEPLQVGFYYARVQTESRAGVKADFALATTALLDAVGDLTVPEPPSELRASYDGVRVSWAFAPSPSNNIAGYQVRDSNDRIIFPLINALAFSENATTSTMRRRVYAVSLSGVISANFAAAEIVVLQNVAWNNIIGGDVTFDGKFFKTEADGYGNCGAILGHAILTNAIGGGLGYVADSDDKSKAFGLSYSNSVDHYTDFFAGVRFKDDATLNAVWIDSGGTPQEQAIGAYAQGDELIINVEKNLDLENADVIKVTKVYFVGAQRFKETIFTFPTIPVRFPAYAGIAIDDENAVFYPNFQLSGELIPIAEQIPINTDIFNATYDGDTGTLEPKGASAYATFQNFLEDEDGIVEFNIPANSECSMFLDPFPWADPTTPSYFALDIKTDGTLEYRTSGGSGFISNYNGSSKIALGKENAILTVRVNGVLVYEYGAVISLGGETLSIYPVTGVLTNIRWRKIYNEEYDSNSDKIAQIGHVEQTNVGKNKAIGIPEFDVTDETDGKTLEFQGGKLVSSTLDLDVLLPDQTGNADKVLTTNGTTADWAAIAVAVGMPIGGAGANRVFIADGSGNLSDSSKLKFVDSTGVLTLGSSSFASPNATSVFLGTAPNGSYSGSNNTFVGAGTGGAITVQHSNVFLGDGAGGSASGDSYFNVYVGRNAGAVATSRNNVFLGYNAGANTTTGEGNIFIGSGAGLANTTGTGMLLIGGGAGANATANFTLAIGQSAGGGNTSGTENTYIGLLAGTSNQTGEFSTWVGARSGQSGGTSVHYGAFFGYQAGNLNSGNFNTYLGSRAGSNATSGTNNAALGYNCQLDSNTGSNQTNINDTFIATATQARISGRDFKIEDGKNIIFDTTTGSKIGGATGQKFAFWNANPIVQPTTGIAAAAFTANTSGIVDDSATFDGYTIGQIAKALRNVGLLA